VVRLRRVQTGSIADRSVRVLSGLHAGERIVAEGAAFLKDGQTVRLLDSCRDASHGP
jgi:multidrug efflux pump subunit AcrA (membrane-fusion protein)